MRQMKKRWQQKRKSMRQCESESQVTNNEGVDTAKSNGLDSINNIQPTVVKKDEVKTAIDKAAEAKNGNRSNT